ncbi:MAG: extracellular solute-binding protein [Clostridia bacterium]|nr:sugar ABC transporter substrate-binding protein [Bacillota bacterium]MBO2522112.1 sugar ABC transporter substrate-binding protein [Bacillota bacterium]
MLRSAFVTCRRALVPAVILLALGLAAGAHAQTKLTVGVFPDYDSFMREVGPLFEEMYPDIQLEVQTLGFQDHHNALLTALATGSGAPDVVAIEIGYLGRFASGGGLTDLSQEPFRAGELSGKFAPFAWGLVNTLDGRIIAIPTDSAPGTMFYRIDVLEAAGLDINEVETWDDLVQLGHKVTRDTDGDGVVDTFLITDAGQIAQAMIRGNIPEGEGLYFDVNGRPLVDSPRFVNAFKRAQEVRLAGLDARIGAWSNEWYEAFNRGITAVEISGAWLAGHLQNWMAPDTKGLWRVRHLPENMYVNWGGTFWAIPEQSQQKEAAWKFIQFAALRPDIQVKAFTTIHAYPALLEALDHPVFFEGVEFLGGQQARLLWSETVANISVISIHPGDPVASEIVDSALGEVLSEGRAVEDALAEARMLIERRLR